MRVFMNRGFVAVTCVAAMLAGCGLLSKDDSSNESGAEPLVKGPKGCVQGVILHGQTNERIKLPKSDAKAEIGVFALIRNRLVAAKPASKPDAKDGEGQAVVSKLDGEYTLCGLPLDEKVPLFVWVDGFESFQSHVLVDSRHNHIFKRNVPSEDGSTTIEEGELEKRAMPTLLANVRLFPLGEKANDLKFQVTHAGRAVEGATVELHPTNLDGHHAGQRFDGHDFLVPSPERMRTLRIETDANGLATFEAAQLVLGGTYDYVVKPSKGGSLNLLGKGDVTVGLISGSAKHGDAYTIFVDLENNTPELALVGKSNDDRVFDESGQLTLYFNREVEVVPGTQDDVRGVLLNSVAAELVEDIPNNNAWESVKAEADGHKIILTPMFKNGAHGNADREPGLAIVYSGLQVRPKTGLKNLALWSDSNAIFDADDPQMEVKFFGGNTPSVARMLVIDGADTRTGVAGQVLTEPLTITVLDQNSAPMAGITVTFAAGSESGTLRVLPNGSDSLESVDVTTDAQGHAQVEWTLGNAAEQTVNVTVGGGSADPVSFKATTN